MCYAKQDINLVECVSSCSPFEILFYVDQAPNLLHAALLFVREALLFMREKQWLDMHVKKKTVNFF
jgi:hypothetical protein